MSVYTGIYSVPLNNVIPVVSSTQMNEDDIDHRMSTAPPSHIILAYWHFAGKQEKQLYGQFHIPIKI